MLITHEHEDHFNIPSLNRLDRRIPIVLPARASTAARTILQEMGFRVLLATPGQRIAIKDLELFLLGPDHVATDNKDEWDVLQFLVRDDVRDGNLFCAVVVQMTEEAERALAEVGPPGLWCMTNN